MGRYDDGGTASQLFTSLGTFMRRCLFCVLSVGSIPAHFAFIMDGNRRYAKKKNMEVEAGHRRGFSSLMLVLKYCYELGVKYVTIYAFSIENFKRKPAEVQNLMDLLLEKINGMLKEESIVNQYGVRVYFIGNLKLLSEPVRVAAEKVMTATANNSKVVLLVCLAYTSSDEIVHAVQESCKHKLDKIQALNGYKVSNGVINREKRVKKISSLMVPDVEESLALKAHTACNGVVEAVEGTERINGATAYSVEEYCDKKDEGTGEKQGEHPTIKLVDVEKNMYMAVAPDPNILLRSSGETRLSNFLIWQTSNCLLYSPAALWPEIGLWHVVWAVLNFQCNLPYLEKKKKQL
ncbi:Alkyl transferase [Melia azedarach]|uniref:Alkyl transferase n=1 Tax=Melia azedarach TaxID=155640 RepID=A0ACC1Y5K1_MELAZ|nr:Alkyl transferase [Melia azedarach]